MIKMLGSIENFAIKENCILISLTTNNKYNNCNMFWSIKKNKLQLNDLKSNFIYNKRTSIVLTSNSDDSKKFNLIILTIF